LSFGVVVRGDLVRDISVQGRVVAAPKASVDASTARSPRDHRRMAGNANASATRSASSTPAAIILARVNPDPGATTRSIDDVFSIIRRG
ncbi:MAG TPA: hypothetical protein VGA84_11325, partial [Thermoanaerobaculia bacterium]